MDKPKMSIADIEKHIDAGRPVDIGTDGTAIIANPAARYERLNEHYKELVTERNALKKELATLRRAFQWPYVEVTKLNDLQMESIRRTIPRLKQAHFTNLRIRINGEYEEVECDWLKHLVLP